MNVALKMTAAGVVYRVTTALLCVARADTTMGRGFDLRAQKPLDQTVSEPRRRERGPSYSA
jgi:hypothetical protein